MTEHPCSSADLIDGLMRPCPKPGTIRVQLNSLVCWMCQEHAEHSIHPGGWEPIEYLGDH